MRLWVCVCACLSVFMSLCVLFVSILLYVFVACTCCIIWVHGELFFGITGSLSPFHPSSNTHLHLVWAGLSQQPHCFVLKVHFYFAFKWMEMQMYAVLWVGGETDTGVHCPLREQGALWSCEREDGVVPTPPLSLFTWKSIEYCSSLHRKRQGAPTKRGLKNHCWFLNCGKYRGMKQCLELDSQQITPIKKVICRI